MTGRDLYLKKVVKAGPHAQEQAELERDKLVQQVMDGRHPRTNATLNQLIDKYMVEGLDVELSTRDGYEGNVRKHIRPLLGHRRLTEFDAELFDSFYAELRRCRDHCSGKPTIKHVTTEEHRCTSRCKRHVCKPLADWTIRKVHYILSGAFKRAVRWKMLTESPITEAEPPPAPPPHPEPPTAEQAAEMLNAAWTRGFGAIVWLAITSGARRGELCALRWKHFQVRHKRRGFHNCVEAGCDWVLILKRAIGQVRSTVWEKDTKTHQHRHIALDPETVAILTDHRHRCEREAAALGVKLTDGCFIFSPSPEGTVRLNPDALSNRYNRLAKKLGIDTVLKNLRHYSATVLIAAGVDVRTVAGRLGHGSGGVTTLRVYAAWIAERDQRASTVISGRMPFRPAPLPDPDERAKEDPHTPFEHLAADLYASIRDGSLRVGEALPTVQELAMSRAVTVWTAHRAMVLLKQWGAIKVSRGQRAIIQSR